jgi:predicted N-acetyltransferase YhbS
MRASRNHREQARRQPPGTGARIAASSARIDLHARVFRVSVHQSRKKGSETMEFVTGHKEREAAIVALFTETFTAAEGEEEGKRIGELVRRLLQDTDDDDLFVFTAEDSGTIVGGIVFSRLAYPEDERTVFLLAPVAVASDRQGEGIGQALLAHGLAAVGSAGVDVAITYGDPAFYTKVGFQPVNEADAAPPLTLTQPEGWLAQSLTSDTLQPLRGPSRCVSALDDPVFW